MALLLAYLFVAQFLKLETKSSLGFSAAQHQLCVCGVDGTPTQCGFGHIAPAGVRKKKYAKEEENKKYIKYDISYISKLRTYHTENRLRRTWWPVCSRASSRQPFRGF